MTSLSPNLPPDKQREMLRQMLTIRRFEERASADYLAGKIYGVVHCYIGEEAVAVGVCTRARSQRPDHLDASRPRPLHRQGRRPEPHDGRAVRPADRLLQGQGRLDAHRRFRASACSGPTASSRVASRSSPARASRRRWKARAASRSPSSATAHRTPARSTSASTSRRPGSCRCSTCARTTCTPRRPRPRRRMR